MIQGIFFARFLPQEGTRVVHQSPPGCIVSEPGVNKPRLFDFETMAEYIIPRQAFCNRYVTICDPDNKYRILGHPVCIKNERYERNEFMFNFCIVISADAETDKVPYEPVVRGLASTFTEMEIQNQFLSQEDVTSPQGRRSIGALIEIIKEDINNYNECMIPVVIKHIDGIKDVRRIAHDADVAIDLTKIALQHLLYYDSILMMDLFLFGNIYAPTPEINDFIADKDGLQDECANYVYINGPRLANFYLCRLFTSLCTSRTIKEWLKLHMDQGLPVLNYVDVRRFIQFGIIKGLIYRVHKYAVSSHHMASLIVPERYNPYQGLEDLLLKYTDGCHCFDQIIVEKNMGDTRIMEHLRKYPKGDVEIVYR
ncbi:hypothetical protein B7463_g1565, partial [Scytalidium lignicola]